MKEFRHDDDEVRVRAPQFLRRELSVEIDEGELRDRIAHLEANIAESSSRLRHRKKTTRIDGRCVELTLHHRSSR